MVKKNTLDKLNISSNGQIELKEIIGLRKSVGWKPLSKKIKLALKQSQAYYTIRSNKQLVGFLRVVGDGSIHAIIVDLIIHPDYQRKGLGTKLLKYTVKKQKEKGVKFISLTYDADNKGLTNFYKKADFKPRGGGIIFGKTKTLAQ